MAYLRCQIPSCDSHRSEGTLFRFPKNPDRARLWLNAIKDRGLSSIPIEQISLKKICGKHFTASSFRTSQRNSLNSNAVPSLNLNPSPDFKPLEFHTQDDPLRYSPGPPPLIKEKSVHQRCRICLMSTDNAIPLNHSTNISGEDSRTLCEILNKFSKVEIAVDDNKPQSVCIDCVEKARIAYEFSICCEKSELVLQKEIEKDSVPVLCIMDISDFVKINEKNPSTDIDTKCAELVNSSSENVHTTTNEECLNTRRKVRRAVKKVNKIICVQCRRNFSKHVKFKSYTRVIIGKKRYQCAKCEARFACPRNLNLHVISHKGILRYKYPKLFLIKSIDDMGHSACSVPGCRSGVGPRFRFPHPQMGKERFQRWLSIINSPKLNDLEPTKIYTNKKICGRHFEPQCFIKPNKLKFSAIPTLFVAVPEAAKGWNYAETKDYQPSRKEPLLVEGFEVCEEENVVEKIVLSDTEHNYTCRVPNVTPPKRASAEFLSKKRNYSHRLYAQKISNQSLDAQCLTGDPIVQWVCRVCLVKTENGVPLDYTTVIQGEESRKLSEIISECCNVEVCCDDDKPQSICIDCAEKARASYEFRKCCLKSDLLLKSDKQIDFDSNVITYYVDVGEFEKIEKMCNDPKLGINPPTNVKHVPKKSKKTQCDKTTNVRTKQKLQLLKQCKQCRKPKSKSTTVKKDSKLKKLTVCLQCYGNFKKQAVFKSWIRKKRHSCVNCGARFSNPGNLHLHRLAHHSLLYQLLSKQKGDGVIVRKSKDGFVIT